MHMDLGMWLQMHLYLSSRKMKNIVHDDLVTYSSKDQKEIMTSQKDLRKGEIFTNAGKIVD